MHGLRLRIKLKACALYNPDDLCQRTGGPGPRRWLGDALPAGTGDH